jgi:hypothetical protein
MIFSSTVNTNSDELPPLLDAKPKKAHLRPLLIVLAGMFVCFVATILFFPWIADQMMTANARAIGERGRDIVDAINAANRSRTIAGLPSVWPKTILATSNRLDDISGKVFHTSSEYFYELYDGCHVGSDHHKPYIRGFHYGKLAGAGVNAKYLAGQLTATNNIWIIAANITDEDDPLIPILMTRNVDATEIERVVNTGLKSSEFEKNLEFSKPRNPPFGDKQMVFVYRNGKFRIVRCNKRNLGPFFNNKELPPRDPSKPPIVYLMP